MKVLVIDDESLIRKSLARALRGRHHEVVEAENGQRGLNFWNEQEFDMVFLDLVMPDLSGFEVLKAKGAFSAKLILMTAFSEENRKSFDVFRPHAFLRKPFENIFEIITLAESIFENKP